MSADNPGVLELTEENFAPSINDHPFAVVDFWAPWCAPCRAFAPTFVAAAAKHPDVLFAKVNTEDQQAIGANFNIRSIPTLMIFRNNIIVYAEAGALPASALDQVIDSARALDMDEVRREVDAQAAAALTPTVG
jgi:thioredoxin 1